MEARVHAIGWTGLFNGFREKNSEPIDPSQLIPYPDQPKREKDEERVFTTKTAKILAHLMDEGAIPSRAAQYIHEMEEISQWRKQKNKI